MRDSFQRSEEHLDIEDVVEDKVEKTKELAHETIQKSYARTAWSNTRDIPEIGCR